MLDELLATQLWLAALPPAQNNARAAKGEDEDRDSRALRVLIVEDEFFISLDIQSLVEALGHTVVGIAVTADEAIDLARREQPDVALMDVRILGARDGIEAAREIFSRFGVPSLFVTANADPQTRARAEAVEPLGFLAKPVSLQDLRLGLRRVSSL